MDEEIVSVHGDIASSHWWFRGRRAVVRTLLKMVWKEKIFGNIIDIGGGGGSMVSLLQEFGQIIAVLEPNLELASYAQKRFKDEKRVTVFTGDLESLGRNNYYDVVALFDVLEHIERDTEALIKIRSMLKVGGSLVVTVPAFGFLWSNHDEKNGHKRRYTRDELLLKLKERGFEVERATYFNFFLFPIAFIVRVVDRYIRRGNTDFSLGAGAFNDLLYYIFSVECTLLRLINLPFGVSIFALAVKNDE